MQAEELQQNYIRIAKDLLPDYQLNFFSWVRSSINVQTRIKSLSRISIEMYYFYTPCAKYPVCARKRVQPPTFHLSFWNSYFRYKCEKVILSWCGHLRPSEARVKRPHEDKITFSLAYRTQFFDTTCGKFDLGHAFFIRACAKSSFAHGVLKSIVRYTCERWFYTHVIVEWQYLLSH